MSPVMHPVAHGGTIGYRLRHVGPKAVIWPNPPGDIQTVAVLNQPEMIGRMLPVSIAPGSPDYQQGQWQGRIGDAGDGQVIFPNSISSDGTPWRDRFHSDGHNEYLEIYNDEYLETVLCIVNPQKAMQTITVAGQDGFFLLKKVFERDWIVTQAPRDVIERGTQVWVPTISDDFSYDGSTTPAAPWTVSTHSGGTVLLSVAGGLVLSVPAVGAAWAYASTGPITLTSSTNIWRADVTIGQALLVPNDLGIRITEADGDAYSCVLQINQGSFYFNPLGTGSVVVAEATVPVSTAYSVLIESDGEWVTMFVNGKLIGGIRRNSYSPGTPTLQVDITLDAAFASASTVTVMDALLETQQPFLMRGTDKGDYALPNTTSYAVGTVSAYPPGGLHARYFNDLDLAADANRLLKIMHPIRTQVYGGTSEYANQQDPQINGQANASGAADTNWSVRWFGSIYLGALSQGDYSMRIDTPTGDTAVRIWIGRTILGQQRLFGSPVATDHWVFGNQGLLSFTVSAAALTGSLPYGAGTVVRDGWYPFKMEYAVDADALAAPVLRFINVPGAGYTDPGGTSIGGGAQTTVVPATSFSPLGCVDNRYQGIAHFDLVQQVLNGFGYQASVEPQRLESGLFPGVLAPRWREGHDTDIILEPDTDPRRETILNYTSQEDASDMVTSLQGNGAGFSTGGQLQALVFDHTSLENALFDIQGWQDFGDSAYISLLEAQLNGLLGLRLTPWQIVSADPRATPRLSYLWPLPGGIAEMRWRPGDGVRLRARDISVWDVAPRQMLTVQRQFAPAGVTGTAVGWSNRPRGLLLTLRQLFYTVSRLQRSG